MSSVVLTTGAGRSGGPGQAIARPLEQDECSIMLHDRRMIAGSVALSHSLGATDELKATADTIRFSSSDEVRTVTGDLLGATIIENIVAAADVAFGRLDIMINNAGKGYLFGTLVDIEPEHLDALLGVNLRAPMLLGKCAAKLIVGDGRGGWIVCIAGRAAKYGFASANAVCPGHVTTGLDA